MSGPRISTGTDSKQDYGTPRRFLDAVEKRFGVIVFDLAAHAGNHVVPRYFAPAEFVEKVERGKTDLNALLSDLVQRGADQEEARDLGLFQWKTIIEKGTIRIPNRDRNAAALDSFNQDWCALRPEGVLWDNCEFSDIEPWAKKHAAEAKRGANSLLLTPAVFANWHRDHVAGVADVYELSGRLCFDGKNVFPKDCRLSHFWPGATGKVCIWEWAKDRIVHEWRTRPAAEEIGRQVIEYMRTAMAMPHSFDGENTDQEQNWIAGHMHAFAAGLLRGAAPDPADAGSRTRRTLFGDHQ